MKVVSVMTGTAFDQNDTPAASLSLDRCGLVADAAGVVADFSSAVTTLSIACGLVDDSANWAVTVVKSAGLTGNLVGKTFTVTALSVDSGTVDFTATRPGFANLTKRFHVGKIKQGVTGPQGPDSAKYLGASGTDPVAPNALDYYLYTGDTNDTRAKLHVYQWTGTAWVEDTDSGHISMTLKDALTFGDASLGTGNAMSSILDALFSQPAFQEKFGDGGEASIATLLGTNPTLAASLVSSNANFIFALATSIAFIQALIADQAFVTELTSSTAFVDALTANTAYIEKLIASNAAIAKLETLGLTLKEDGTIVSENFDEEAGTGFSLSASGIAKFMNAIIRGRLEGATGSFLGDFFTPAMDIKSSSGTINIIESTSPADAISQLAATATDDIRFDTTQDVSTAKRLAYDNAIIQATVPAGVIQRQPGGSWIAGLSYSVDKGATWGTKAAAANLPGTGDKWSMLADATASTALYIATSRVIVDTSYIASVRHTRTIYVYAWAGPNPARDNIESIYPDPPSEDWDFVRSYTQAYYEDETVARWTETVKLWSSTNGTSWTEKYSLATDFSTAPAAGAWVLTACLQDGTTILVLGSPYWYKSTGGNFTRYSMPYAYSRILKFGTRYFLWGGRYLGISDNGTSITSKIALASGYSITSVSTGSTGNLFVGTSAGYFYKTANNGTSFSSISSPGAQLIGRTAWDEYVAVPATGNPRFIADDFNRAIALTNAMASVADYEFSILDGATTKYVCTSGGVRKIITISMATVETSLKASRVQYRLSANYIQITLTLTDNSVFLFPVSRAAATCNCLIHGIGTAQIHIKKSTIIDEEAGIITTGYNSDGRWVKFFDGTLICWTNGNRTMTGSSAGATRSYTWNFPLAFYDNGYALSSHFMESTTGVGYFNSNSSDLAEKTHAILFFYATSSGTSYIRAMAIGRWKA